MQPKSLIIDVANLVNEITGNRNRVEFVARRDWDKITLRGASIEKARRVLGYDPGQKRRMALRECTTGL